MNQSIIQDLTILASLNMLNINVVMRSGPDTDVKKTIKCNLSDASVQKAILHNIKLDARNSIVYIAYTELLNLIQN